MKRLCIFVHWDKDHIIDPYIITYIKGLQPIARDIIFVSNCFINEEEQNKVKPFISSLIIRENKGLDFGAWKAVILNQSLSSIAQNYDELVLANSSCFAPLFPFEEMFSIMQNKNADFWGITENKKSFHKKHDGTKVYIPPHIQSYFLVFNKKVLTSAVFEEFWRGFNENQNKDDIILNGETALTSLLISAGFQSAVYMSSLKHDDLSIFSWHELIKNRCPTLKVKIFSIFTEKRPYRLTELFNYQTFIAKAGSKYSCLLIDAFLQRSYPLYIKAYDQYIKNPVVFNFISMPINALRYIVSKTMKVFLLKLASIAHSRQPSKTIKHRILFSNFSLAQKFGSELYTLELSSRLMKMGYEVAIFCFIPGIISQKAQQEGIKIFTPHDQYAIETFKPDIVHIHHLPCLYFLSSLALNVPFIYSILGPAAVLESLPGKMAGINRLLVVSQETLCSAKKKLQQIPPTIVFQNWFDDKKITLDNLIKKTRASSVIKKVAVVTNHLDPMLKEYLVKSSQLDTMFSWTHVGYPENAVDMSPEILEPFDAVITIGRTVLLAAAMIKPVFMFDIHGSDGWLTKENFEAISWNNFSGRTHQTRPTFEDWQQQFSLKPDHTDLTAIAYKVWGNYTLSKRASQLITIYNAIEPETPALVSARKKTYETIGRVFGEMARTMDHFSKLHIAKNTNSGGDS